MPVHAPFPIQAEISRRYSQSEQEASYRQSLNRESHSSSP